MNDGVLGIAVLAFFVEVVYMIVLILVQFVYPMRKVRRKRIYFVFVINHEENSKSNRNCPIVGCSFYQLWVTQTTTLS